MADFTKNFPGSVTLQETEQTCEETQRRKRAQLKKIELGEAEIDGVKRNANIVSFKDMRDNESEILKELKFIDVSTVEGMSNATAASGTHKLLFEGRMFVKDKITDVKVFGKKRVVP